jgi:hypothetical protein
MTGEVHDVDYPEEPPLSDLHTEQSARMLEGALVYLLAYYLAIIPCNLMPASAEAVAQYDDGQFKPRFKYFRTFRQYENLHMFFWLAKDLAWNRGNIVLWFICLVPTVLVAADFFFISAFCKVCYGVSSTLYCNSPNVPYRTVFHALPAPFSHFQYNSSVYPQFTVFILSYIIRTR